MRNIRRIMVGLLGAIILSGCAAEQSIKTPAPMPIEYVLPARAMHFVQGRDYLLGLTDRPTGLFIDVRDQAEYEAGHIPGAIHHLLIDPALESTAKWGLDSYETLLLYGADYSDPRPEKLAKDWTMVNGPAIHVLRGGMSSWLAEGYAIEEGPMDF